MKKPKPKRREHVDFHEAEKWIEEKLGYPLRDTLGRHKGNCNVEYRDYWHFLIDRFSDSIHDPCVISITSDLFEDCEPWQAEITAAFIAEFGEDAEYWVEW